jgi:hypothetical protein
MFVIRERLYAHLVCACTHTHTHQAVKRRYVCAVPHHMKRISLKFFNPGGHCTCVLCRSVIAANGQTSVSGVFCTRFLSLCPTPHQRGKMWSSAPYCGWVSFVVESLQIIAPIKASITIKNCAVLGYYAASISNFLQTFRDNISFLSSSVKNPVNGLLSALKFVHKMSADII